MKNKKKIKDCFTIGIIFGVMVVLLTIFNDAKQYKSNGKKSIEGCTEESATGF